MARMSSIRRAAALAVLGLGLGAGLAGCSSEHDSNKPAAGGTGLGDPSNPPPTQGTAAPDATGETGPGGAGTTAPGK